MNLRINGSLNLTQIFDDKKLICTLHCNTTIFTIIEVNIETQLVATQDDDPSNICIWNMKSGYPIIFLPESQNTLCLLFVKKGTVLISGDDRGYIKIWDMETMTKMKEIKISNEYIFSLNLTPDHKYILIGSTEVIQLDANTFEIIKKINVDELKIYNIYLSPNSKLFATSSWEFAVKIWDIETGECIQVLEDVFQFTGLKFASEKYIATKHFNDSIKVWELGKTNYLFSHLEKKFNRYLKIDWVIKKCPIDHNIKNEIIKSLDILPKEIIDHIIKYYRQKECLTLNNKTIFITN